MKKIIGLRMGILLLVLALCGCGSREKTEETVLPEETEETVESAEPLVVEAEELDYTAPDVKTADEIRNTDGYYVWESFRKEELSEADWDKALEPFEGMLELCQCEGDFSFEGKEEIGFITGKYRDSEGYAYVVTGREILMIDPGGKAVTSYTYNPAGEEGIYAGDAIVSDAGRMIFPISGMDEKIDIVSFDRQSGEANVLGQMEERFFRNPLCALRGSKLFYRSDDWIVCWNMATGERTRFFDLKKAGTNDRNVIMSFSEDGVPELYIGGQVTYFDMRDATGDETVVVLGNHPPLGEVEIRISDIPGNYDNGYVASCAGMFGVINRSVQMNYQTEEDRDAHRTRVMAEIAAGKEADILCVDENDLRMLWEKGAIVFVEELLSQETLDALLPGVKELCTVDGEMAGITPVVSVTALSTSRKNWSKDTWSMREFLEQLKKLQKKYAVISSNGSRGWCSSYELMLFFVMPNLESMGLIDYQNGVADLDSEEYMELLRFCKDYGQSRDLGADEYDDCMKNQENLSRISGFVFSFDGFENIYGKLYEEGDCNLLGFPAGDSSYNYFNAPKWLAVSRHAVEDPEKKEAVAAFLEDILSETRQKTIDCYFGVRRPTPENCYETDEPAVEFNGKSYKNIVVCGKQEVAQVMKADGSTYLEEFMEFMESCRAQTYFPADMRKIIVSEVTLYFEGERSVEETAKVTQNRMQLYLNERK